VAPLHLQFSPTTMNLGYESQVSGDERDVKRRVLALVKTCAFLSPGLTITTGYPDTCRAKQLSMQSQQGHFLQYCLAASLYLQGSCTSVEDS